MTFNINEISFSYRGSYLAISYLEENFRNRGNKAGLFLRTVHGDSNSGFIGRIIPVQNGKELTYTTIAKPEMLSLSTECGKVCICYASVDKILIKADAGISIKLDSLLGDFGYDYVHPIKKNQLETLLICSYYTNNKYYVNMLNGTSKLEQDWEAECANNCEIMLSSSGDLLATIEEAREEWHYNPVYHDFESCVLQNKKAFVEYYHLVPKVPLEYENLREMAAYLNWAATVGEKGHLKREAMLMSKNWMTKIWSWDHCFNAMALSYGLEKEAYDQFMVLFDFQDKSGRIPDCVNDRFTSWNFCKPPIHGWASSSMIIIDGILKSGKEDLAKEAARKFCDLCSVGGFSENFNALTGQGLRDRAYTWTSSVFLILANGLLE